MIVSSLEESNVHLTVTNSYWHIAEQDFRENLFVKYGEVSGGDKSLIEIWVRK